MLVLNSRIFSIIQCRGNISIHHIFAFTLHFFSRVPPLTPPSCPAVVRSPKMHFVVRREQELYVCVSLCVSWKYSSLCHYHGNQWQELIILTVFSLEHTHTHILSCRVSHITGNQKLRQNLFSFLHFDLQQVQKWSSPVSVAWRLKHPRQHDKKQTTF